MIFINIDIFIDKIIFNIFKLETNNKEEIVKDKLVIPKSFDIGNQLSYLRKFLLVLIEQYNIRYANIKINHISELNNIAIIKIEGTIEELLSNCGVNICK